MTPEAVEALRGVADAVDGARAEIAGLSIRWAEDMEATRTREDQRFKEIRTRENRRFQTVNRTLAVIVGGTVVALLLLAGVLLTVLGDENAREDRFRLAQNQSRCNAVVADATLARLSNLAVATPNRVNGGGTDLAVQRLRVDIDASRGNPDPALLAHIRDEVAAILAASPAGTPELDQLRADVSVANRALLNVADVCYGPNGPDPTPLDGDPTK